MIIVCMEKNLNKDQREQLYAEYGLRILTDNEMRSISQQIPHEIIKRLMVQRDSAFPRSFATFLIPHSNELAQFEGQKVIALEVGGTKMRSGLATAKGNTIDFGDTATTGFLRDDRGSEKKTFTNADDFFDHLLKALPDLPDLLRENPDAAISIIFSFPGIPRQVQNGLDAVISSLTKGFSKAGLQGKPFGELFMDYLFRKKHIEDKNRRFIIVNDTPVLLTGENNFGAVIGSGYNFAVKIKAKILKEIFEKNNELFPGQWIFPDGWSDEDEMIVNIEAGGFDFAAAILDPNHYGREKTEKQRFHFLHEVDMQSPEEEHGKQLDEKLVSGQYLIRSFRVLMQKLADNGYVTNLNYLQNNKWDSQLISEILTGNWEHIQELNDNDKTFATEICQKLRELSLQVVKSHFIGAMELNNERYCNATIEGSVFWNIPGYSRGLQQALEESGISGDEILISKPAIASDERYGSLGQGAVTALYYFNES